MLLSLTSQQHSARNTNSVPCYYSSKDHCDCYGAIFFEPDTKMALMSNDEALKDPEALLALCQVTSVPIMAISNQSSIIIVVISAILIVIPMTIIIITPMALSSF